MTVSQGIVTKINGGKAYVKLKAEDGCGTCPSRAKCKSTGHTEVEILLPPNIELGLNDRVLLALNDSPVAAAALLVYLLPIICLLIGAAVGSRLDEAFGSASPVYALLLAVVCFIAPLIAFKLFKRRINGCAINRAQLLEVLSGNDAG